MKKKSKIFKLIFAIVKHQLKEKLGDGAIEIIASEIIDQSESEIEKHLFNLLNQNANNEKITSIFQSADNCFSNHINDPLLKQMIISKPFNGLLSFQAELMVSVDEFDEKGIINLIEARFIKDWGDKISSEKLKIASKQYRKCLDDAIAIQTDKIQAILYRNLSRIEDKIDENYDLVKEINSKLQIRYPIKLVDEKLNEEIDFLRKGRFFSEFNKDFYSLELLKKLRYGEFEYASSDIKAKAFYWIIRILQGNETVDTLGEILDQAISMQHIVELDIAKALILSKNGENDKADSILSKLCTPETIAIRLMLFANTKGSNAAINWFKQADYKFSDLESDGKLYFMIFLLDCELWSEIYECIEFINDDDLNNTPALYDFLGRLLISQVVPESLRKSIIKYVPFNINIYRLKDNRESIEIRNKAKDYFIFAIEQAQKFDCKDLAMQEEEYAAWLLIVNPDDKDSGINYIKEKFKFPERALHLINIADQFDINIDYDLVEKEIARQIARNGKENRSTTLAKFVLFRKMNVDPEKFLDYVDENIDELSKYIAPEFLAYFEIEYLSFYGKKEKAKERLEKLETDGLEKEHVIQLNKIIMRPNDNDYIEILLEQYRLSKSFEDLLELVFLLEKNKKWIDICNYGRQLFDITQSVHDFKRLIYALSNTFRENELILLIQNNLDLYPLIGDLQILYPWALYYEGKFIEAENVISELNFETKDYRQLRINLAIVTGDWDNLGKIIINAIEQKKLLESDELLRLSNLAICTNLPYTRKLLLSAVNNSGDDPSVLVNAYFLAAKAGFENEEEIGNWLHTAAELSSEKGPLYKKNIKELFDYQIEFQKKRSDIWKDYTNSTLPISLVANS